MLAQFMLSRYNLAKFLDAKRIYGLAKLLILACLNELA
jgi:hypothetical protein